MNEKLEQIIKEIGIEEAEKAIAKMKREKSVERWRAGKDEVYYCIDIDDDILIDTDTSDPVDDFRYNYGNYFKSIHEAEIYKRRQIIRQQISDIAMQLNDGNEIDWSDGYQMKYCLEVCNTNKMLITDNRTLYRSPEIIYCLSEHFPDAVKAELSDEDFKFYFGVTK